MSQLSRHDPLHLLHPHVPPHPQPLPHHDAGHHQPLQRVETPRWSRSLLDPDASDSKSKRRILQLHPTDHAIRSMRTEYKTGNKAMQYGLWVLMTGHLALSHQSSAPGSARGTAGRRGRPRTMTTCCTATSTSPRTARKSKSGRRC